MMFQGNLTQSENDMLEFLEKNKNITSPNLILQRERIQREIKSSARCAFYQLI